MGNEDILYKDKKTIYNTLEDSFYKPKLNNDKDAIYFCGHSLGLQVKNAKKEVDNIFYQWKNQGIDGYFEGENCWLNYHEKIIGLMSQIVGAKKNEIAIMNTLTLNLHLMLISFYSPKGKKRKILMENNAFPSDIYALKSHLRTFYNYDPEDIIIELKPRNGENTIRKEDVINCIKENGDEISLIMMGGVNYYTGQLFDIEEITKYGHKYNCVVGFDLAHAVGNVILKLNQWKVDFAIWCTYKYLNSGPGNIGACFIHENHCGNTDIKRLVGWWGNKKENRFNMEEDYDLANSAQAWQISCPPIICMASLLNSLQLFCQIGMNRLRERSIVLTGYLVHSIKNLEATKIKILTPDNPEERGSMISLYLKSDGQQLYHNFKRSGIYCDWRNPNIIRLSCVPMYNNTDEIDRFIGILKSNLIN